MTDCASCHTSPHLPQGTGLAPAQSIRRIMKSEHSSGSTKPMGNAGALRLYSKGSGTLEGLHRLSQWDLLEESSLQTRLYVEKGLVLSADGSPSTSALTQMLTTQATMSHMQPRALTSSAVFLKEARSVSHPP